MRGTKSHIRIMRQVLAVLMAAVLCGGPSWANCRHGAHQVTSSAGAALAPDDHCPICDGAMPVAETPDPVRISSSLVLISAQVQIYVASVTNGVDLVPSGRGPPASMNC